MTSPSMTAVLGDAKLALSARIVALVGAASYFLLARGVLSDGVHTNLVSMDTLSQQWSAVLLVVAVVLYMWGGFARQQWIPAITVNEASLCKERAGHVDSSKNIAG